MDSPTGENPTGDFVPGNDGSLYGMTSSGGTFTHGTIFKTTTADAVTVFFQFNLNVTGGGSYSGGTIFLISPAGAFNGGIGNSNRYLFFVRLKQLSRDREIISSV